jgi:hypothetical protein
VGRGTGPTGCSAGSPSSGPAARKPAALLRCPWTPTCIAQFRDRADNSEARQVLGAWSWSPGVGHARAVLLVVMVSWCRGPYGAIWCHGVMVSPWCRGPYLYAAALHDIPSTTP